jgi:cytochrome c
MTKFSASLAAPALLATALLAPVLAATPALAAGDPVRGAQQFIVCKACHTVDAGQPDRTGPNLNGVFGKPAATNRPRFKYSAALKASRLVWDDATLDAWLTDPVKKVPGTAMHFIGVPRKPNRDNIIAYLKSVKP